MWWSASGFFFGTEHTYDRKDPGRRSRTDTPLAHRFDLDLGLEPRGREVLGVQGKLIARRNLIWSIVAEHLGFSIWMIWSIVATKLPQAGFNYTTDQLFQLVALPDLSAR